MPLTNNTLSKKEHVLLIAGEKSGEEHALSFYKDLLVRCPNVHFFGVGGSELASLGFENLYHLNDFSSWGVSEIFEKIPFYFKAYHLLLDEVKKRKVKTCILIDFQTFNLFLAVKLKKMGVDVLYYVAPQVWAWKKYRVHSLRKSVHTLFSILPFEKKWLSQYGVHQVISTKHPLLLTYQKELESFTQGSSPHLNIQENKNLKDRTYKILLLPGSRMSEVTRLLPVFIATIEELKKCYKIETRLIKSNSLNELIFNGYVEKIDYLDHQDKLLEAIHWADFSLAASGTVTLTLGLFQLPTIVCYKGSLFNQFIFESFVRYSGPISLTNIVHEKILFPELIQDQASVYEILTILKNWIKHPSVITLLKEQLKKTKDLLTGEDIIVAQYMESVITKNMALTTSSKVDFNE